ncbi:hypothetical protein CPB85DRAFT_355249 [Mucidula mucida]|nr:hypothetical protein CPB85DRAFT_355249 [Mucidula mucida]
MYSYALENFLVYSTSMVLPPGSSGRVDLRMKTSSPRFPQPCMRWLVSSDDATHGNTGDIAQAAHLIRVDLETSGGYLACILEYSSKHSAFTRLAYFNYKMFISECHHAIHTHLASIQPSRSCQDFGCSSTDSLFCLHHVHMPLPRPGWL